MSGRDVLLALAQRDPFIRANFVRWDPVDGVLTDRAGLVLTSTGSAIISEANPESHAAQNLERRDWWGYQCDGQLLAVCGVDLYAAESTAPEAAWCGAHLSGFGTRPQARRQGVGAALMAAVSRHFIAQYGLVHFGVWDENRVALRIYRRLGYSTGAHVQNFGKDVH